MPECLFAFSCDPVCRTSKKEFNSQHSLSDVGSREMHAISHCYWILFTNTSKPRVERLQPILSPENYRSHCLTKVNFSNITFTRVLKKRWMYLSTKYWTQMGVSNQQIRLLVFRIVGICNLYMLVWYLTIFDRMRVSCSHRDGINLSYSLVVVVGTDCNLEWDAPNNMATIQVSVNAICPILAIAEALQCTGNVHTS